MCRASVVVARETDLRVARVFARYYCDNIKQACVWRVCLLDTTVIILNRLVCRAYVVASAAMSLLIS